LSLEVRSATQLRRRLARLEGRRRGAAQVLSGSHPERDEADETLNKCQLAQS
jgi:hypothetical protein